MADYAEGETRKYLTVFLEYVNRKKKLERFRG